MGKQSGFMMLVIALLLVVVAGFATAFVTMMTSGANSTSALTSANLAYDLAYSGLENGNYSLLTGNCSSNWSANVSAIGGEYKYKCTPYSAASSLSSSLNATSTSIPIVSATNFAPFGSVTIDSETIYYNGVSGNTLLNAQRGQSGSAASHSSGAAVLQQQYIINSQGGSPSLSNPNGLVTLGQSAFLSSSASSYYAVGAPSGLLSSLLTTVILNYNGSSWSSVLGGLSVLGSLTDIDVSSLNGVSGGLAVGYNLLSLVETAYSLNGSSWSNYGFALLTGSPSCACNRGVNLSDCWIGAAGPRLIHNGASYSGSTGTINGLSCAGNTCLAIGSTQLWIFPSNSTTPFSTLLNLTGSGNFQDIRCLSANSCFFITTANHFWYFNPSNYAQSYVQLGNNIRAIDCTSPANGSTAISCFIIGSGKVYKCAYQSTLSCDNGTSISSGDTLDDIACNASTDCLVIGHSSSNVSSAYRYNGSTWTKSAISISGGTYTLNAVGGIGSSTSGVTPTVNVFQ